MIYQKIYAIQQEIPVIDKDVNHEGNIWTSDEQIKRILGPLLQKHKVVSYLKSNHIKVHGKNRVISCTFIYTDTEDDTSHEITVEHEIGDTDITGTGITLCSKRADIHTFRIQTTDDQAKKGLKGQELTPRTPEAKAEVRQEMAMEKISQAMPQPDPTEVPVTETPSRTIELNTLHEKWAEVYQETGYMGYKIVDSWLLKALPFDAIQFFKARKEKFLLTKKRELHTAMRLNIIFEYMKAVYPNYKIEAYSSEDVFFIHEELDYNYPWFPPVIARDKAIMPQLVKMFTMPGMNDYLRNLANEGKLEQDYTQGLVTGIDISTWLKLASPKELKEVYEGFLLYSNEN